MLPLLLFIAASLEGRLWNPVTGAPVRKADVIIGTTAGVQVKRAVTDVNGHFLIDGLPAGSYRIAAGRAGYLPTLSNVVVTLKEGEAKRDLLIPMDTPAVVSGHVLNQDADPVERVPVVALRREGARLIRSATTESDDQGAYRLSGLAPGNYILATLPTGNVQPAFYPDAPDFAGATPLTVARGSEARDLDFHVRGNALGSLSGVVHAPEKHLVRVRVARSAPDAVMSALPVYEATLLENSRYVAQNLSPGDYVVMAWDDQPDGGLLWSSGTVSVGNGAAELDVTPGPTNRIEGEVNLPAAIRLRRVNGFLSDARAKDGKLEFRNITPGTWEPEIIPRDPDQFVDSIKWGDREMLGQPLEIGSGVLPKLRVTIGEKGGTVEGEGGGITITPENGGKAMYAAAGDDGRYKLRGIRPGKYRVACSAETIEIKAGAVLKRDCKN